MNEVILLNGCRVKDAGEGVFDLAQAKLVPLANHMINDLIVGSKICGNRHFFWGGVVKETTYKIVFFESVALISQQASESPFERGSGVCSRGADVNEDWELWARK